MRSVTGILFSLNIGFRRLETDCVHELVEIFNDALVPRVAVESRAQDHASRHTPF